MLKYRLLLGTLMTIGFAGLVLLDGCPHFSSNCLFEGHLLMLLIAIVAIPANFEFAALARSTEHYVFLPITVPVSILIAAWPYILQMVYSANMLLYVIGIAVVVCAILIYQSQVYGVTGVIGNCGANLFAIAYLGFLCSFIMLVRLEYGVWAMLIDKIFVIFSKRSVNLISYDFLDFLENFIELLPGII